MLKLIWRLGRLAYAVIRQDRDLQWLLEQALRHAAAIEHPDNRREALAAFKRDAEIRAKVRAFDEVMRRLPKQ